MDFAVSANKDALKQSDMRPYHTTKASILRYVVQQGYVSEEQYLNFTFSIAVDSPGCPQPLVMTINEGTKIFHSILF